MSVRAYIQNTLLDMVRSVDTFAMKYDRDGKVSEDITKPVAPGTVKVKDTAIGFGMKKASRTELRTAISGWKFSLYVEYPLEVDLDDLTDKLMSGIAVNNDNSGYGGQAYFMPDSVTIEHPTNNSSSGTGTKVEYTFIDINNHQ